MKILQNIEKLQTAYFVSYFLYNFARVLPHAILTVILLNKGMTVGNIAIIQSFFMIASIAFEFPSGILTDSWSEKKMYILSLILLGLSYFIIMETNNFVFLCCSWFIYGISSASMSGSLETFFLRRYEGNEFKIKKFNVAFNNTNLYSTLIGGGIGAFVYKYTGTGIYWIADAFIVLSILVIVGLFKEDATLKRKPIKISDIYSNFRSIRNTSLMKYILLMAFFQIIIQLFYQFWQVMFLNNNIKKVYFGFVYVLFQIIAIFANYLFKKVSLNKFRPCLILSIALFLSLAVCVSNKIMFMVMIILFLIPFNLYSNQLTVDIQKFCPKNIFSSVISLSGTVSSVISMLYLWIVGILDNFIDFNEITVVSACLFVMLSFIILLINKTKKPSTNNIGK